ncbi:MAG: sulfatase-like hydrolase/transferase [Planctomycetes bacterium]|nr:sulfatase-like hydrolase/transferase [Planctomycetota bacterium]
MGARHSPLNVLFIISDQHKRSVAGCYGNALASTPNIDRLARSGTVFDNAYCPSPLCGPSRAAVMTGTHCHTCGDFTHQQLDPVRELPTLGSVFRDAGYSTAAFGKVHIIGESQQRDLGFDERALRIFTDRWRQYRDRIGEENVYRYASYSRNDKTQHRDYYNSANVPVDLPDAMMYDNLVTDLSIDFLRRRAGSPWFLWMGLEKPHPEWYAPPDFHDMFSPADMPLPETLRDELPDVPRTLLNLGRPAADLSDNEVRGALAAYYANIAYLDWNVGRALDALERLGLAENTVVVYTTDHGEHLFEHGLLQKHCFFEAAVSVPLLISSPGRVPSSQRRGNLVSLIDLFPTLLDLAGISHTPGLEGRSLLDSLAGAPDPDDVAVFSEFYSWGAPERMIRTPAYKYVHTEGDISQLYDVLADPLELRNLASDPSLASLCQCLDSRLMDGWELPPPGYRSSVNP